MASSFSSSSFCRSITAMIMFLSSSVRWLRSGSSCIGGGTVGGRGPRGPTEEDIFFPPLPYTFYLCTANQASLSSAPFTLESSEQQQPAALWQQRRRRRPSLSWLLASTPTRLLLLLAPFVSAASESSGAAVPPPAAHPPGGGRAGRGCRSAEAPDRRWRAACGSGGGGARRGPAGKGGCCRRRDAPPLRAWRWEEGGSSVPVRRSPRRVAAASRAAALPAPATATATAHAGDPGWQRLSPPPPSLVPHGHGVGPGTAVFLTPSSTFPHLRSRLRARPSPASAAVSPEAGAAVGRAAAGEPRCGLAAGCRGSPGLRCCSRSLGCEPCPPQPLGLQLQPPCLQPALSPLDRPFLGFPHFCIFFVCFLHSVSVMLPTHLPWGWQVLLTLLIYQTRFFTAVTHQDWP